jgi:hypothetical protein
MERVTLERVEWVAVARELDTAYRESAPPGLRSRLAAMLESTPAEWGGEACTLDLDSSAADVVNQIVRRGRGLPADPGERRSRAQAIEEVESILRAHQAEGDVGRYRVEHRSGGRVVVLTRTSAGDARQAELSQHAARLSAAGATGEVVLVDEETGGVVARRRLRPDDQPGQAADQPPGE